MGCGSDFVSACPASSRLRTTVRAWFRRQMRTAGLLQTSGSAVAHQPKLRRAAKVQNMGAGVEQPVARQDHNLKAAGSNPAPGALPGPRVGLRQGEKAQHQIYAGQNCRCKERKPDPIIAEQPAEHWSDDEADAKHGIQQTETPSARILGRDISDIGSGNGGVGTGEARKGTAHKQQPQTGCKCQEQKLTSSTGRRSSRSLSAPITGAKMNCMGCIERHHDADVGRDIVNARHPGAYSNLPQRYSACSCAIDGVPLVD